MKNKIIIKDQIKHSVWDALCLLSLLFLGVTYALGRKFVYSPSDFSSLDMLLIVLFYLGLGGVSYVLLVPKSKIELGKEKLKIKPFWGNGKKKVLEYSEIEKVDEFSFPAFHGYLGLGITFSPSQSLTKCPMGRRGLQLQTKNGEKLWIETTQSNLLRSELELRLEEKKEINH
jgi:hypothetical protein